MTRRAQARGPQRGVEVEGVCSLAQTAPKRLLSVTAHSRSTPNREPRSAHRVAMRLTADVIARSPAFLNPLKDRELDLRGACRLILSLDTPLGTLFC
jgi:hypothetical protein